MPIRQEPFITGSYYHIYNRGVDRASVWADAAGIFIPGGSIAVKAARKYIVTKK